MRGTKQLLGAILTVSVSSCATMSVGSDFDPATQFSSYRTYAWGPADALPTGDPRLDNNPFFDARVRSSVEGQLAAKGFQKVSSESADLLIHYHATIQQKIDVLTSDAEYGYEVGFESAVYEYEEGTLLLDIADARSKQVIWRGWSQEDIEGVLDDPEKMAKRMERATQRILEHFPPGSIEQR